MKIEMDLVNLQAAKIAEKGLLAESRVNVNFGANNVTMPEVKKVSGVSITKVGSSDINLARPVGFSRALTFTGNPSKNTKQIASIAPEYQDFFDAIYKVGGLGNVAGEASVAMKNKAGADIRTFIPYHTQDNPSGGLKVKRPTTEAPGYTFETVPYDYKLEDGEQFVVHVKQEPGKDAPHKIIEDTGISGEVENIKPDLSGMERTPYRLFKAQEAGKNKDQDVYLMYLPDTAKFSKVYNIGGADGATTGSGAGNYDDGRAIFADLAYANFDRAVMDALPKMNDEKFGNFNPASYWLHDRHAFSSATQIFDNAGEEGSYWEGIRAHSTFHNPGRDYQGWYRNPIDFLRIIGSEGYLQDLKESPEWDFILETNKKIEDAKKEGHFDIDKNGVLTAEEIERFDKALDPFVGSYRDELGTYNMCKIPVVYTKEDPDMFSAGTVSRYYGQEMKDPETREIAYGLTDFFRKINTVDIVNGSTPANLNLHQVGILAANATVKNGFTAEIQNGFKPYPELIKDGKGVVQNIDEIYDVKQINKAWFINTVAEASKEGNDALTKLFFNEKQIEDNSTVLGGLSEFKEGDQLFISWGRADKQKGFPVTMESFYQYFSDPNISDDMKSKTKVLMGAGPWPESSKEWKMIQETLKKIQELDGGKYKDNVIYLNGYFSNRIGMFSDWAIVTSEYEPCGITPLEAFASATPVLSHRTGGSPDFITAYNGKNSEAATGFLTKHAYKVNPAVLGAAVDTKGEQLDAVRRKALGKENAVNIKEAMELSINNPEDYKKMSRNAISLKIDWHENSAFNGGKSAIRKYFEDAWHITVGEGNNVA